MTNEESHAAIDEMKKAGVKFTPAEIGGVVVSGVPGVEWFWAMSEAAAWPIAWGHFTVAKMRRTPATAAP